MMTTHQTIISNLTDRINGVSAAIALKGIPDLVEGLAALKELVSSDIVTQELVYVSNVSSFTLYKLSVNYRIRQLQVKENRASMTVITGGKAA